MNLGKSFKQMSITIIHLPFIQLHVRELLVPNAEPLKEGQVIKNEKMAKTLSKIAELGADYL